MPIFSSGKPLWFFLIHFYKLTRHRFNNNLHSYSLFISEDHGLLCSPNGRTHWWCAGGSVCPLSKWGDGWDGWALFVGEGRKLECKPHSRRRAGQGRIQCASMVPRAKHYGEVMGTSGASEPLAECSAGRQRSRKQRKCSFTSFFQLLECKWLTLSIKTRGFQAGTWFLNQRISKNESCGSEMLLEKYLLIANHHLCRRKTGENGKTWYLFWYNIFKI